MTVVVTIQGFDRIEQMLAPERLDHAINRALTMSARAWADDTKRLPPVSAAKDGFAAKGIPVASGSMRQRIQVDHVGEDGATIAAKTNYSKAVHDGAPPHAINSPVFITGVGWRYIKTHPGNPPRPFFDYALEAGTLQRIEQIFRDQFQDNFLTATRGAK